MARSTGTCRICGFWADLGWAGTCAPCWDAQPPINDQAHDEWCAKGACPHGFGPVQLSDGSSSPAEGRVGNHGEPVGPTPVADVALEGKTVDPPQGPQLFDGSRDA